MTERVAQVLELADSLSLTTEEREELIDRLVDTVEPPAAAASTWTPELERRAREALRGENLAGELHEVAARMHEELRASREARRTTR